MENYLQAIEWELTARTTRSASSVLFDAANKGEFTLKEALSIAAQSVSLKVERVHLVGDEPLLYPYWSQVALSLARHNVSPEIISYGPIPEDETASKIRDSGISRMAFGLDGLAANHDNIHGQPELFKAILHDIEKVLAVGMPVDVVTMISDQNIGDLPTLLYVIHAAGVTTWKLQALLATSPWHHSNGTGLADDTFKRLGAFLELMAPQAQKLGVNLELADNLGYFGDRDVRREPWNGCPGGITSCAITSRGSVKGCLFLPNGMIEGDLRQKTLAEIWYDPIAFSYNRAVQLSDIGPNCDGCSDAALCGGGCSAMSFNLTGKLHNDPFCFQGLERRGQ
jgi:radical SAM protein with 4Fe4S-binding SPASM domain